LSIQTQSIVLIGSGNVASQLGAVLKKEGYHISQVYSPTKKNAALLAKKLNAEAITSLKQINVSASIYIIAVKDDVIETIAKQLKLKDKLVVHTSGTLSMDVLNGVSKNHGVFYPLQTFSKDVKTDFKTVPVCIEGSNKNTSDSLMYFAKSISKNVTKINSEQRKKIHLAAVFASNFSNHMYTIADRILGNEKLSFNLLKPLIEETTNKIKQGKPSAMQTGPAIRDDKKTMDAQMKLLSKDKKLQLIYKMLSESIAAAGKKNKS
jgi:predicted short-subunit dehydrogenase-like oxidoreductase (DUF2520 family)